MVKGNNKNNHTVICLLLKEKIQFKFIKTIMASAEDKKGGSPPSPKKVEGDSMYSPPVFDRNSPEYKRIAEKFDKQGGEKIDMKVLEEKAKQLDNKFKLLADFTREAETSNCDMLLFKNVFA